MSKIEPGDLVTYNAENIKSSVLATAPTRVGLVTKELARGKFEVTWFANAVWDSYQYKKISFYDKCHLQVVQSVK